MNTPVNFELAKLLKEKEFDEPTKVWHQRGNGIVGCVEGQRDFFNRKGDVYTSAPTISEVVMWLYEEHGIWIYALRIDQKEFYWSIDTDKKEFTSGENFKTPTEAYEAAIEYTLKNLL